MSGEAFSLIAAIAVITCTHWIGGITAYGSALLALPVLIWIVDLPSARAALIVIGMIQAVQIFIYTFRNISWPKFRRMLFWAGLGLPVGMLTVTRLPREPLLVLLGVILIAGGLSKLAPVPASIKNGWPKSLLTGLMFLGGLIHGAFGTGGAAMVVAAQQEVPEKEAFRGTLSLFWVVLNSILIGGLTIDGTLKGDAIPMSIIGVPLVMLASWHANRVAGRLSQNFFVKLVAVLLFAAGIITIARVFWQ